MPETCRQKNLIKKLGLVKRIVVIFPHKSYIEICSKNVLIYFETQETLNHQIYILLKMICVCHPYRQT